MLLKKLINTISKQALKSNQASNQALKSCYVAEKICTISINTRCSVNLEKKEKKKEEEGEEKLRWCGGATVGEAGRDCGGAVAAPQLADRSGRSADRSSSARSGQL